MSAASGALAQSPAPVTLKFADSLPVEHFGIRYLVQPFMDEVSKRTNGAVTFERFPAQQLGKAADMLALTQSGVVDVGYMVPSYVSGNKLPLSEVAQLPNMFQTSCQGTSAFWKLARHGGALDKGDYAPNKVRVILAVATAPYVILTRDKKINSLADFKGLKLRSTGEAMNLTARSLGAVPVNIAAPDIYDAVARGTVDGAFYAVESISAYSFTDVAKVSTEGVSFGSVVLAWLMRTERWNSLAPEVRKAIDEVADEKVASACKKLEGLYVDAKGEAERKGMVFNPLTPRVKSELIELLDREVGQAWAKQLDSKRKDGTGVLDEFRKASKEAAFGN